MRESFDEQLSELRRQVARMGKRAHGALARSLASLETGDRDLAERVVKGDRAINELESGIEADCLKLLLTQQPVAHDLMLVSGVLRLVADIERIGDQAANISECFLALEQPIERRHLCALLDMGSRVSGMVEGALDALQREDAELASTVMKSDDEVDADFETIKKMVIDDIAAGVSGGEPDALAEEIFDVVMVAKYLERIGDHAVNLAEYVEFMQTGRLKGEQVI